MNSLPANHDSRFTIYDLLSLGHFLRFRAWVALEHPSRREFTQLMPDHVFGHEHRNMAFAIVHAEGQTDHIGRDRRTPRPGFDRGWLFAAFLDARQRARNAQIDKRAFL